MDIKAPNQVAVADSMEQETTGEMEEGRQEGSQIVGQLAQAQHWRAVKMPACCHYSELWIRMVRYTAALRFHLVVTTATTGRTNSLLELRTNSRQDLDTSAKVNSPPPS